MPRIFFQSDKNPVDMIVQSMLTEAQFQTLNGTSWVLMDGRSVAGSAYATVTGSSTIPDARGMVLRGKNNGRSDGNQNPDGDSTLGAYQGDQIASHNHNITVWGGGVANFPSNSRIEWAPNTNVGSSTGTDSIAATGGNETRMKNITVNHFIKINN